MFENFRFNNWISTIITCFSSLLAAISEFCSAKRFAIYVSICIAVQYSTVCISIYNTFNSNFIGFGRTAISLHHPKMSWIKFLWNKMTYGVWVLFFRWLCSYRIDVNIKYGMLTSWSHKLTHTNRCEIGTQRELHESGAKDSFNTIYSLLSAHDREIDLSAEDLHGNAFLMQIEYCVLHRFLLAVETKAVPTESATLKLIPFYWMARITLQIVCTNDVLNFTMQNQTLFDLLSNA